MARRVRRILAVAGGVAALVCIVPLAGNQASLAQSSPPQAQQPPQQSLGSDSDRMNAVDQYSGGSSELLKVPMGWTTPGAVGPPEVKSPVAGDPAAATRGMQYFEKFNCVGCHAPNGGGGMGPSLSDAPFKFNSDPASVFLVISHGAPTGMPAWGGVLPQEVIWDLVAYVESISKPPKSSWGMTVSPAAQLPDVEQVPAEFKQSATPWQFTEPFANGQAPKESSSGAAGMPPPASNGSSQH
jgi:cytochrome c oxidase cbb3-type subunit 3